MDITATIAEISSLSVDERLQLVDAIWDSIAAESDQLPLRPAQLQEVERRLAAHRTHPEDVVPWDEVRDQALARSRA